MLLALMKYPYLSLLLKFCVLNVVSTTEQQNFLRADPAAFKPAAGAWGKGGATIITLADAHEDTVRMALNAAWRNTAPKRLL